MKEETKEKKCGKWKERKRETEWGREETGRWGREWERKRGKEIKIYVVDIGKTFSFYVVSIASSMMVSISCTMSSISSWAVKFIFNLINLYINMWYIKYILNFDVGIIFTFTSLLVTNSWHFASISLRY